MDVIYQYPRVVSTCFILVGLALYLPARAVFSFRKNLARAKATGLPYRCLPIFPHGVLWQMFQPLVCSILRTAIPKAKQPEWIEYIDSEYVWRSAREPFDNVGSDTFFFVCPESLFLLTSDPEVILQITNRRNDFPKPIEIYVGIEIYGKNVVTCEGSMWRRHRKTTAPPFGEKNNRAVWKESLHQGEQMLAHWKQTKMPEEKDSSKDWSSLLKNVSHDCMRLSLYVISRAGFDVQCQWPGDQGNFKSSEQGIMSATEIPQGHKMSYVESMETLLQNLIPLFVLPPHLTSYFPFKTVRLAGKSFHEWGKYMSEIYNRKSEEIINSKSLDEEGMDLMGAMIRGSGQIPGTANYGKTDVGLSKQEILGNSFILFLAGHETAANSIHFALLMLAARPSFQRRLQADLDSILGDRPSSEWSFDSDLPKLFSGFLGAVMNEELRLVPPVNFIPKSTAANAPQTLSINGEDRQIPGDVLINIHAIAAQRHPRHWPFISTAETLDENEHDSEKDLDEFKPERWFVGRPGPHTTFRRSGTSSPIMVDKSDAAEALSASAGASADLVDNSADTASTMFSPAKGAYLPFSIGARKCLGRRFAQIEILAALAVVLKAYSIELSADQYATEDEISKMDKEEKMVVFKKARTEMERKLREETGSIVTLQLRGEGVDLKLKKRGHEIFNWEDDEEGGVVVGGAPRK